MYILKVLYNLSLFIGFLVITGCAASYAPNNWLPETEEVANQTYGGWITIITNPKINGTEEEILQYGGEFISSDSSSIYILYDTLYIINREDVWKSIIELDDKNTGAYGLWTFGGLLSTISNGGFLIFTAPLWLIGGTSATSGESSRDRYTAEYPDSLYWNNVIKFARFPAGLPKNIDLHELKPKLILVEE